MKIKNAPSNVLGDLQQRDSRVAALEAEAARLPKEAAAIEAALGEAKKSLEAPAGPPGQGPQGPARQEKDLEVVATQAGQVRRLYEVKTNKEYSAVLLEIEEIKQEKAEIEEQILGLMEVGRAGRPRHPGSRTGFTRSARSRPGAT